MSLPEIFPIVLSTLAVVASLAVAFWTRTFFLRDRYYREAERELKERALDLEARRLRLAEELFAREQTGVEGLPIVSQKAALEVMYLRREVFRLSHLTRSEPFDFETWFKQLPAELTGELRHFEQHRLLPLLPNPMIESVALFAGINALMAALQVFQRERDYRLAKRTFHENFEKNLTAQETERAANVLDSVAPPAVVKKLYDNAKKCWDHWLESEGEAQMPGEEREVDAAVKSCICRQLRRIIDLTGVLSEEWRSLWDLYGCATRK